MRGLGMDANRSERVKPGYRNRVGSGQAGRDMLSKVRGGGCEINLLRGHE